MSDELNKWGIEHTVATRPQDNFKLFKSVMKRIGFWDTVYFSIKRLTFKRYFKKQEVIPETDLLILAQPGIIGKDILDIPKIGTLNCHSGILPEYRGIDCPQWAIYNNEKYKTGCTIHWVDEGVDTGNILEKYYGRYDYEFCACVLVNFIRKTILNGIIPKGEKQGYGTQYYKMSRKMEKQIGWK